MHFKSLGVLIFGILVAQIAAENDVEGPANPLIFLVRLVLDNVHQLINLTFETTKTSIRHLISKVDDFGAAAVTFADGQIDKEAQFLHDLIEIVKKRSNSTDLTFLNCLERIEPEAADIEKRAANYSTYCIDQSIKATGRNLVSILDDLEAINVDLQQHEEKLDECKNKIFQLKCIKNVVADVSKVMLTIPFRIKQEADRAAVDFAALNYEVFGCIRRAATDAQASNAQVIEHFQKCVRDD